MYNRLLRFINRYNFFNKYQFGFRNKHSTFMAVSVSVSNLFMPILFADDTNLFCTEKNLKDVVSQINVEIGKVYCWVKANKLSLNIDKTNFMLFTPKHFSRNMDGLLINGNQITEVNETKFLGVIIDNKLTWCPHIMYISKKIAKGIGIILKASKVFNNETLFSLYYTFVYPYLNYCIHVWGKAYDTLLRHLIALQNKIIRIINDVPLRTNVDNLYIKHNILSVKRLYSYNVGLFMYKYSNGLLPDVLTPCSVNLLMSMNTTPEMHQCNIFMSALINKSR